MYLSLKLYMIFRGRVNVLSLSNGAQYNVSSRLKELNNSYIIRHLYLLEKNAVGMPDLLLTSKERLITYH